MCVAFRQTCDRIAVQHSYRALACCVCHTEIPFHLIAVLLMCGIFNGVSTSEYAASSSSDKMTSMQPILRYREAVEPYLDIVSPYLRRVTEQNHENRMKTYALSKARTADHFTTCHKQRHFSPRAL